MVEYLPDRLKMEALSECSWFKQMEILSKNISENTNEFREIGNSLQDTTLCQ